MSPISDIPDSVTVVEGDTLTSLAERLWTNLVGTINGLEDPNHIEVGESLLLPALGSALWVTISEGDTLTSLTGAHLWPALYFENQDVLGDPDALEVGQWLRVPRLVAEVPPLD